MLKRRMTGTLLLLAGLLISLPAEARVKLTTLPVRERVEIQLDHDQLTLVEEERVVPLTAGVNQVDFSWTNTRIDPSTIVFRVVPPSGGDAAAEAADVSVLSVTYPPNESALVWQVSSDRSAAVTVRISYLLGGLSKDFNYRAVVDHDESTMTLSQYLRVRNFAGEAYADAEIYAGFGDGFLKPIGTNQTKQMLVQRVEGLPVVKTYTANPAAIGWLDRGQQKLRVQMHYRLHNDAEHGLGAAALPPGKVRIFQKDAADAAATTAFLGEDVASHTAVGDHADLFLGIAQDVVVRRTVERRDDERVAGNLFHRSVTLKYEIGNFKDQPVTLNLVEMIEPLRQELGLQSGQPAEWALGPATSFAGGPVAEATDQTQVTHRVDLPARPADGAEPPKTVVLLELIFRNQW